MPASPAADLIDRARHTSPKPDRDFVSAIGSLASLH
jgi:hypothetical protein